MTLKLDQREKIKTTTGIILSLVVLILIITYAIFAVVSMISRDAPVSQGYNLQLRNRRGRTASQEALVNGMAGLANLLSFEEPEKPKLWADLVSTKTNLSAKEELRKLNNKSPLRRGFFSIFGF